MKNGRKIITTAVITASAVITMSFTALASPYHHNSASRTEHYDGICTVCGVEHSDYCEDGRGHGGDGHGMGEGGLRRHDGSCYRTE